MIQTVIQFLLHPATLSLILHAAIVVSITVRVITRRPPVGVALAWLFLVLGVPYVGAAAYLLIGEKRISRGRRQKLRTLRKDFETIATKFVSPELLDVDWSQHRRQLQQMGHLGNFLARTPTLHGSHLELYDQPEQIFRQMIRDIDAATQCVLMEFYIWNQGGLADEVLEALKRASALGVRCLVLVDALGARPWWKGRQPAELRQAGIELRAALPVGPLRTLVGRADLRLHRKIVVVDGRLAWTGSMNMVDPKFFKQDAGVGEWIDAMVRIEGATVAALESTMLGDWLVEGNETSTELFARLPIEAPVKVGSADVQVISSGPQQASTALLHMLLAAIHAAEREVVVTTPYLIPDESLLQALCNAAARGVDVRIIVPETVDSFLTHHACRSYFEDLLAAGVHIHLYRGGLLHTKSLRIDDDLSIFGTANLDLRSQWLNYEVSLFVYDQEFSTTLAKLHATYLADTHQLDPATWAKRPFAQQLLQDTLRLISPLL